MTDREALLRAVMAAPADDAPRLVLADWLDEHGEPDPAEFIRVQCALARLPGPAVRLACRGVIRPRRGTAGPAYQAVVPVGGRAAPEVGQVVRLVPLDESNRPLPDLVLTGVAVHPWAGRSLPAGAEAEVTGVPVDPADLERRAALEARERALFARLRPPPVRVGPHRYEAGLPADGQPATVRRGFVDELEVPAEAFLDHADGVTAAHPLCVLRLESDPGVERAEGPEPGTVDVSLLGRDHWVTVPADLPDDEVVLALFAAEWPAVRVRLPGYDAGGDLPDPWGGY
jgi:uncharacterized protein (TIGR02996 family)